MGRGNGLKEEGGGEEGGSRLTFEKRAAVRRYRPVQLSTHYLSLITRVVEPSHTASAGSVDSCEV